MAKVPKPLDSLSNNACDSATESPKGELFRIGHKRLFSISLRSEDMEEQKDGTSERGAVENDPELETTSSNTSTSDADAQQNAKSDYQWFGFFRMLKKGPATALPTGNPAKPSIKKLSPTKSIARESIPLASPKLDPQLCCFKSSWKNFLLSELQTATNNFSQENLIGQGGYSEVYKGHLQDGQLVAIKRLTRGTPEEMTADFLSELGILVHVNHPNIANVIGYGVEGGMHLILHLSPHGSLASLLTGAKEKLKWDIRYKIALGTAEGLSYLHEGCQRRIIHRDIKAANILLTEDFEAQISDFGLAKWLPAQWTHLTVSQFEGTFGYLPPEFFMHGIVDEKTDVYSYGVLLLELITGRLALDKSQQSLLMWAKPLLAKNNIEELVDPSLGGAYDLVHMNHIVSIASMCMHHSSAERPQMSQVVEMLKDNSDLAGKPQKRSGVRKSHSVDLFSAEEHLQKDFALASSFKRSFSLELLDANEHDSGSSLNDTDQQVKVAALEL